LWWQENFALLVFLGHRRLTVLYHWGLSFTKETVGILQPQGLTQDLVHVPHQDNTQVVFYDLRNLLEVLLVFSGYQYRPHLVAMRREKFLFETSNGHDATTQGQLTRHGHIKAHRDLSQSRNKAGRHRDAGAGPILANELRKVQVEVL